MRQTRQPTGPDRPASYRRPAVVALLVGAACRASSWSREISFAGRSRRYRVAPCPPCGLGLSHWCGGRAVDEGPDFLGDGAPVGGGGQLAEHREQPEVDT